MQLAKGIPEAASSYIVTYKKDKMTTSEVEFLIQNLKAECNCDIEHLSAIGALIIGNGNDDKAKTVSGPQLKGENLMKYLDNRMNFDYVDMDWIPVLDNTINRGNFFAKM